MWRFTLSFHQRIRVSFFVLMILRHANLSNIPPFLKCIQIIKQHILIPSFIKKQKTMSGYQHFLWNYCFRTIDQTKLSPLGIVRELHKTCGNSYARLYPFFDNYGSLCSFHLTIGPGCTDVNLCSILNLAQKGNKFHKTECLQVWKAVKS